MPRLPALGLAPQLSAPRWGTEAAFAFYIANRSRTAGLHACGGAWRPCSRFRAGTTSSRAARRPRPPSVRPAPGHTRGHGALHMNRSRLGVLHSPEDFNFNRPSCPEQARPCVRTTATGRTRRRMGWRRWRMTCSRTSSFFSLRRPTATAPGRPSSSWTCICTESRSRSASRRQTRPRSGPPETPQAAAACSIANLCSTELFHGRAGR